MRIDVTVLRVFTDSAGNFGNPLGVVDAASLAADLGQVVHLLAGAVAFEADAEGVLEQVTPVGKHVEDDSAALFLARVP